MIRFAKEGLLLKIDLPSWSSVSILKNWAHSIKSCLEKRELLRTLELACMSLLESKAWSIDLETFSALLKRSPMTKVILLLRSDIFDDMMKSKLYQQQRHTKLTARATWSDEGETLIPGQTVCELSSAVCIAATDLKLKEAVTCSTVEDPLKMEQDKQLSGENKVIGLKEICPTGISTRLSLCPAAVHV